MAEPLRIEEQDVTCPLCCELYCSDGNSPYALRCHCKGGYVLCEACHMKLISVAKSECPQCKQRITRHTKKTFRPDLLDQARAYQAAVDGSGGGGGALAAQVHHAAYIPGDIGRELRESLEEQERRRQADDRALVNKLVGAEASEEAQRQIEEELRRRRQEELDNDKAAQRLAQELQAEEEAAALLRRAREQEDEKVARQLQAKASGKAPRPQQHSIVTAMAASLDATRQQQQQQRHQQQQQRSSPVNDAWSSPKGHADANTVSSRGGSGSGGARADTGREGGSGTPRAAAVAAPAAAATGEKARRDGSGDAAAAQPSAAAAAAAADVAGEPPTQTAEEVRRQQEEEDARLARQLQEEWSQELLLPPAHAGAAEAAADAPLTHMDKARPRLQSRKRHSTGITGGGGGSSSSSSKKPRSSSMGGKPKSPDIRQHMGGESRPLVVSPLLGAKQQRVIIDVETTARAAAAAPIVLE